MTNSPDPDPPRDFAIRPSRPSDLPGLVHLMHGHFDFYAVRRPPADALERLLRRLWDDPSRGHQLVAVRGDRLLGFATLYSIFETLATAEIVVMNDLFVAPEARRQGIGEALIAASRQYASDHEYASLEWVTAHDNRAARRLYDRVGGRVEPWVSYILEPRD